MGNYIVRRTDALHTAAGAIVGFYGINGKPYGLTGAEIVPPAQYVVRPTVVLFTAAGALAGYRGIDGKDYGAAGAAMQTAGLSLATVSGLHDPTTGAWVGVLTAAGAEVLAGVDRFQIVQGFLLNANPTGVRMRQRDVARERTVVRNLSANNLEVGTTALTNTFTTQPVSWDLVLPGQEWIPTDPFSVDQIFGRPAVNGQLVLAQVEVVMPFSG